MSGTHELFEMPVCDVCGETVFANICQTKPTTPEATEAIWALLLAAHGRLAGHVSPSPKEGT